MGEIYTLWILGKAKLYINSKLINTVEGSGLLSEDWGQNTEIGTREEGKELNGFVDEFYIYTKALNQVELDNLVKSCSMGKLDVLLLYC